MYKRIVIYKTSKEESIIETKIIQCFKEEYPKKLLQIKEYPQQLYCIGNISLLNHEKIVAIVGSRSCSEYGRKYAKIFASELAKRDICVISGLALGIDTAAHFGAMSEVGRTIAVLGGGLKDIYPKDNEWLFNQILQENGCIITEYSDIEKTNKSNFPKRNRIISAIADAVLVIEASKRSGSRITARYAKMQGKKVYCIPNSLDSANIAGIKELIADGAKIITNVNQLISDLYQINTEKPNEETEKILKKDKENLIPTEYKEIYNLLKVTMSREEIAMILNKDINEINTILTMMEIDGFIEQIGGNNFKRL